MTDPIKFNSEYPEKDSHYWLTQNDCFHMITRDSESKFKWRCTCRTYFGSGICDHALLFHKCFFPHSFIPPEHDASMLEKRPSSRKPSPFAPVSPEPTFQSGRREVLHWNPSGLSADKHAFTLETESDEDIFRSPADARVAAARFAASHAAAKDSCDDCPAPAPTPAPTPPSGGAGGGKAGGGCAGVGGASE
jgi:hypothetical protein